MQDFQIRVQVEADKSHSSYERTFAVRAPNSIFATKAIILHLAPARIFPISVTGLVDGGWAATEACSRLTYQPTREDLEEFLRTILTFQRVNIDAGDENIHTWVQWNSRTIIVFKPGHDIQVVVGHLAESYLTILTDFMVGIYTQPSLIEEPPPPLAHD